MVELLIGLFVGGVIGVFCRSLGGASEEKSETPRPPPFDELLAALRGNIKLLNDELKSRRLSGLPEYIGPVETAIERTKKAISLAEGWS
jgi:hypothetical protein